MKNESKYQFIATIWKYPGKAGWYFVTLPIRLSKQIRQTHGVAEEGWGRLKAKASVGKTKWTTSIWFDSKTKSYMLPIKTSVRKAENLEAKSKIRVEIELPHLDPRYTKILSSAARLK